MNMSGQLQKFQLITLAAISCLLSSSPGVTEDSFDFEDDSLFEQIERVNEGELKFLTQPPEKKPHSHHNKITITASSLVDGWVELNQCHENLDPTPAIDIRFNKDRIRKLTILADENIEHVRVNGHVIELLNVQPQAKLCLKAESQALQRIAPDVIKLRNGPFMRQFLDGFYPMKVTLDIQWPDQLIQLAAYTPEPGNLGKVITKPNSISWEGVFEGKLFTEFTFWQVR